MEAFAPVAILIIIALIVCVTILAITTVLGPKNPLPSKLAPYECGIKPDGKDGARIPFKNKFYLIAVLFLLFDVEAAFLFPWALVYRNSLSTGGGLLVAMLFYVGLIVLALVYMYQKRVLEVE